MHHNYTFLATITYTNLMNSYQVLGMIEHLIQYDQLQNFYCHCLYTQVILVYVVVLTIYNTKIGIVNIHFTNFFVSWIKLNWTQLNWIKLIWITLKLTWNDLNWFEFIWTKTYLNWRELKWTETKRIKLTPDLSVFYQDFMIKMNDFWISFCYFFAFF